MKKYLQILVSGIASGVFIGIGVSVYLALLNTNKLLGACLFGFGLYCVIVFNTFLYTGKAGYILDNKPSFLLDLLVGVIGNFIGITCFCLLMKLTSIGDALTQTAENVSSAKINSSFLASFIGSIFCGFMIYLAVVGHKKCDNPFGKVVICFTAIMIFIVLGFEHCVANVGYFVYGNSLLSWIAILKLLVMVIGNGLGSVILDGLLKLVTKLQIENK